MTQFVVEGPKRSKNEKDWDNDDEWDDDVDYEEGELWNDEDEWDNGEDDWGFERDY